MKKSSGKVVGISPHEWRELVHDALHSQSALEQWHEYLGSHEDDDGSCLGLILYDQKRQILDPRMLFLFEEDAMLVQSYGGQHQRVRRAMYTPTVPSKFLHRVFTRFVSQIQEVDILDLRSYLAAVDGSVQLTP